MIRAPQRAPDEGAELRAIVRALSRSAPELHRLVDVACSVPPNMTAADVEARRAVAGQCAGTCASCCASAWRSGMQPSPTRPA